MFIPLRLILSLLFIVLGHVTCQFMTREQYQNYEREKQFGGAKLNALAELEAEVVLEGFSLYRVASEIIDARDAETGMTKLMLSATRGVKDDCKHLIVQGANLELTKAETGETALLLAVSKGNYHSTVELLKAHANMHHRNKIGQNALHTAIASGLPVLVEAILRTDDSWRHGTWAAQYHQPPIADTALPTGMTAMMMCSQDGQVDMVRLLLEYRADVNARSTTGETALMYASIIGHSDIVKLLLENGADPSAKNDFGFTAVIMAASRGHLDVVERYITHETLFPSGRGSGHSLQQEPSLLDIRDSVGHSALDHAVMNSHQRVVDRLMEEGTPVGRLVPWVDSRVMQARQAALDRKNRAKK
jgi:ankyrin repeat protein